MEYLDDEDQEFPKTLHVIEAVEQDRINQRRLECEIARQAARAKIGKLRTKGFAESGENLEI